MELFASISEISTLAGEVDAIWTTVMAVGIAIVGYRIGKRVIGKF